MRDLNISVKDKIANFTTRDGYIVCGNSDYRIKFTFDTEWNSATSKKARFIWNGQHKDVDIDANNFAEVPVLSNTKKLMVGVYSDKISTTAVTIPCVLSVLCEGDGYE